MPGTKKQRRFFGAVLGGAAPKPKGMTMEEVRDFARKPGREAKDARTSTAAFKRRKMA